MLVTGNSWEQSEAERRAMIDVNAVGTMNGTVAALERMTAAGSGHVINVISLAGLVAAPGEVAYSASKHAAMAFTLGTLFDLRRAGHDRIEMSAVCPDGIWTPMLEGKLEDPDAAGSFSGASSRPSRSRRPSAGSPSAPARCSSCRDGGGPMLRIFDAQPAAGVATAAAGHGRRPASAAALQEADRVRPLALMTAPGAAMRRPRSPE